MSHTILRGLLLAALAALVTASPAGAANPTAGQFHWKRLSGGGDYFLNYDGERDLKESTRDWPITMIFYDDASVNRVKGVYDDSVGYNRTGGYKYEGYQVADPLPGRPSFGIDRDKGKKDDCVNSEDNHFRAYAPSYSDRFSDPRYGDFVVVSTHIDRGDDGGDHNACSGDKLFGDSELVENDLADLADFEGYTVHDDAKPLGNHESNRLEGDHRWYNGGRATTVRLP